MPHSPPPNRPKIGTAPPKNPLLVTLAPTLAISDPIDLENNYHPSKTSIIPTTNNAIEQVIRVFTQHHSTFCGFENIESARLYLGVFEKAYRFTPFSDDARERIRGKCLLELAGYDIQELPMAQLLRGLALQCSTSAFPNLVPDVSRSHRRLLPKPGGDDIIECTLGRRVGAPARLMHSRGG